MSDGLSLGKVQGQKLPISMHDLSKDVLSIVCHIIICILTANFPFMWGIVRPKQFFFLSVKTELLVDFEPKLKWDPIVILNNISWVHILLSEENNVVYSFAQI